MSPRHSWIRIQPLARFKRSFKSGLLLSVAKVKATRQFVLRCPRRRLRSLRALYETKFKARTPKSASVDLAIAARQRQGAPSLSHRVKLPIVLSTQEAPRLLWTLDLSL
jgi:hypothetical protein